MKADLHCHSTASDGLLAPADVVARAHANGVELLALTDHDDVSGLSAAGAAAQACGVRLVPGVEISVTWRDTALHVVGLGIDPHSVPLRDGLTVLRTGREARAGAMAASLERIGVRDALAGAARFAANGTMIGRTHFARFLVERGLARDVKNVFDHYLVKGKPGYVAHRWAALDEALGWIVGAGGLAVLAHPGRYRISRDEMRGLLDEFAQAGGRGIEVVSGAHSAEQVHEYANLARHFGLLASSASDFHGPRESRMDVGAVPALPDDLSPAWRVLV